MFVFAQLLILMIQSSKRLLLKIGLERSSIREQAIVEVQHQLQNYIMIVNFDNIITAVNKFLEMRTLSDDNFYSIYIETEKGYRNVRDCIGMQNIVKREKDHYIQVSVQLKAFNLTNKKNLTLSQKINRIQQDIVQTQKSINDAFPNISQEQLKKFYDLAYFYSQPLVNSKEQQQDIEVTYARQYQSFIKAVQIAPTRYIRVKMMVATQYNIKQTLNAGVNILHFASHGDSQGLLRLQDNQCRLWSMSYQNLINMLLNVKKPLLIVFNVCYSAKIAQKVNEAFPEITTIGYQQTIRNQYCQLFTKRFYQETLSYSKRNIGQIIQKIKVEMREKDQMEGLKETQKLMIFGNTSKILLQSSIQTKHQGVLQYDSLEVLESQPIGVKKQIYLITKIFQNKKKDHLYFKGQEGIGKTLFWKKCLRYMQSRKIIDSFMEIDLKYGEFHIKNILGFQLYHLASIEKYIKKKQVQRKNNIAIVFDHCDDIIRHERGRFVFYLKHQILPLMKFGKIVLITREIYGQQENSFEKRSTVIPKEPFAPYPTHLLKFIKMHNSTLGAELNSAPKQKQFQQKLQSVCCNPLQIIKGFSRSKTPAQLIENLKNSDKKPSQKQIKHHKLENKLVEIEQKATKIVKSFVHSGIFKRTQNQFVTFDFFKLDQGKSQNPINQSQMKQFYQDQLENAIEKILKAVRQIQFWKQEELCDIACKLAILILRINNISYFLEKYNAIIGNVINGSFVLDLMIQHLKTTGNTTIVYKLIGIKIRILLFLNNIQYIYGKKIKITDEKLLSQILQREITETLNCLMNGPQQIKRIQTIIELQQIISIIQNRHSKFGDKLDQNQFQAKQKLDYHQLLNDIEKYYAKINLLKKSNRTIHLYSDHELMIMEIIGLKLIEMLLTTIFKNKIYTDLEIHKSKVLKIGDILVELKKLKDKSYGYFFKQYMKGFIKTRIGLEKNIGEFTKKGISLTFFGEIKELSRKLKQKPYMEQIQAIQSSSRSSTIIFMISSPLVYHRFKKQQNTVRCTNIARYQSQLFSNIKKTCSKIQSDVLIQITQVKSGKVDTQIQQEIQALISFVYLNCINVLFKGQMKECIMYENHQGISILQRCDKFVLPSSLITIICGSNAKTILDQCTRPLFSSDRNIFIWISFPQIGFNKSQNIKAIRKYYETYLLQLISQTIIINFTSSFLKKITSQSNCFINLQRQIITVFEIAKTQALCKTAQKFENKCFKLDMIAKIMAAIDIGIQLKNQELKKLPIITFKKGNPNMKYFNDFIIKQLQSETYPEVGLNRNLYQLLTKIHHQNTKPIILQSNDQKVTNTFLQIFMLKLQKFKKINGEVVYYDFYQSTYNQDEKKEILKMILKIKNAIQLEQDSKQLYIINGVNAEHIKIIYDLYQQNININQQNEQIKIVLITTIQQIQKCSNQIQTLTIQEQCISLDVFQNMRNQKELGNDYCVFLVDELIELSKKRDLEIEQLISDMKLIEKITKECQRRKQIHDKLHMEKFKKKKSNDSTRMNKSQRH